MTRLERELLVLKKLYWNGDTFGAGPIPKNWEEICDAVNDELDSLAILCGGDGDYLSQISAEWWDYFCENDEVFGIRAVWED